MCVCVRARARMCACVRACVHANSRVRVVQSKVFCGNTIPGPEVYDPEEGKMHVQFFSIWLNEAHAGFRLSFSFHPPSVVPDRLPTGRWNCSAPHWTDFKHHFPCNLKNDCEGLCWSWGMGSGEGLRCVVVAVVVVVVPYLVLIIPHFSAIRKGFVKVCVERRVK